MRKGQTATELAIFGAILMFMMGVIARSGLQASYAQNQQLKAMRLAFKQSYMTGLNHDSSRINASILFLEDRLTTGSGKYPQAERIPFFVSGSGTFTRNMFMPIDWGEKAGIPVTDVFINGQQLELSTGAFGQVSGLDVPNTVFPNSWDPLCLKQQKCTLKKIDRGSDPSCPGDPVTDPPCYFNDTCSTDYAGCTIVYSIVPNSPNMDKWCDNDPMSRPCPVSGGPGDMGSLNAFCNLGTSDIDCRFDLDHDGKVDVPQAGDPVDMQKKFAWQWYPVKAVDVTRMGGASQDLFNLTATSAWQLNGGEGINPDTGTNTSVDIDYDLKEESVMEAKIVGSSGVIQIAYTSDAQNGDLDTTLNESDMDPKMSSNPKPRPGLSGDVQMFTFNGNGNYLLNEEGKLYAADTRQFIRNTQKRDQVDIIQRVIQLSNDTDRLCDAASAPVGVGIEACNNCFDQVNILKTCFDEPSKRLFVRSRITNLGGRKWVTPLTD